MKKWYIPFLLFLILGTVYIAHERNQSNAFISEEGAIFGTIYHVTYQSKNSLKQDIEAELAKVDSSLSMFNPQSNISKLNTGKEKEADKMVQEMFSLSKKINNATYGAFDPTVAPLVNAWGFGFKHQQIPDEKQVDSLRQFVGFERLRMNNQGFIQKDDERMMLDFSAIAKGYATDRVAQVLRKNGVQNFMVEIGGEIVVSGTNAHGDPWRIGINKPDAVAVDPVQEILSVSNCAMATSGNYRNYYVTASGNRLAHTIDPRSGYPIQHNILSSTVFAPSCAVADAYATAFMVLGLDSAQMVLEKHPELQAYFIIDAGKGISKVVKSKNWKLN